jgi:hypothetical protein
LCQTGTYFMHVVSLIDAPCLIIIINYMQISELNNHVQFTRRKTDATKFTIPRSCRRMP